MKKNQNTTDQLEHNNNRNINVSPTTILEAENLYKSFFKTHVLKGINLQVAKAESVAIMGASGEGKTTLLHLLAGLEKPTEGRISYQGQKLSPNRASFLRSKHFGFVFQFFNLLEDFSALDNVLMPSYIYYRQKKQFLTKGRKLLKEVGLEHLTDHNVKSFSGGEKQRVAIARAFCNDPEIIFADEPSGNLDHENSKKISRLLLSFAEKNQKTLIIATHNLELAALCNRKYLLKNGILEKV